MNLRGGWALIRKSLFSYTASRGFFWTLAFGWMVAPLVYMFVWVTAAGQHALAGFYQGDFIFYYLSAIVVNQFTYPVSNWTVGDMIRTGIFSHWLLRPVPVVSEALASDTATKIVCMPFVLIFVLGIGLVLRPPVSLTLLNGLAFLVSLLLAQALRFLLGYVLALLALWSNRADSLLALNDTLFFLLAGLVAPTALLPGILGKTAVFLPYRLMIGFPVELLMGRLDFNEVWAGFAWQFGWLGLLLLAHQWVWKRGVRRYSAVGG